MGVSFLSDIFDIGADVLTTVLDAATNALTAQLGDSVGGQVRADGAEWWQHVGFNSRPSPPVGGKASCQAISIRHSDRDCVIATRDVRSASIYGNLKDGETCLSATGADGNGQARVILKQNGGVYLSAKQGNVASGTDIFLAVTPDGLQFVSPAGKMFLDAAGFRVVLSAAAGGATIRLGAVPGIPLGLGSQFTVTAGAARLDAPAVLLGPSGAGYISGVGSAVPVAMPLQPLVGVIGPIIGSVVSGCVKFAAA